MIEIIFFVMVLALIFITGALFGAMMLRRRLIRVITQPEIIRQAMEDIGYNWPQRNDADSFTQHVKDVPGMKDYVEKDVKETMTLFDSSSKEEQLKDNLYRLHRHDKPESPFDRD
jgi:hypothetical protein